MSIYNTIGKPVNADNKGVISDDKGYHRIEMYYNEFGNMTIKKYYKANNEKPFEEYEYIYNEKQNLISKTQNK